jgi:tight adherence protein C
MEPVLLVGVGVGTVALIALCAGLRSALIAPRDEVLERVERVTRAAAAAEPKPKREAPSRIRTKLVHAGHRRERAVEVFFGAKLALGLTLAALPLVAGALRGAPLAMGKSLALLLGGIGFYAPNLWLRAQAAARQRALARALPDALDLLLPCVEAGLGLEVALLRIAREIRRSAPLLAGELRLTIDEIGAGVPRADAFRRLADRTGLEELRSLSAGLMQTEMFGTNVAQALRVHSSRLRARRTHRAEERAATVSFKLMLPLIVCILPALFAVVFTPAAVRIITMLLASLEGRP